jgi:hypothetical protein
VDPVVSLAVEGMFCGHSSGLFSVTALVMFLPIMA